MENFYHIQTLSIQYLNDKKKKNPIRKWSKDLNIHFQNKKNEGPVITLVLLNIHPREINIDVHKNTYEWKFITLPIIL